MEKTKITECMVKQKRRITPGEPPKLVVRNPKLQMEEVLDSKYCRILGANLQNNHNWETHLETGNKALFNEVRKNLGMLKFIGKQIPMECRNTLVRGLVIIKINYLISMWGGTTEKYSTVNIK